MDDQEMNAIFDRHRARVKESLKVFDRVALGLFLAGVAMIVAGIVI